MGQSTIGFSTVDLCNKKIFFFEYIHRKLTIRIMKVAICFTCVFAMAYAESGMAAPYTLIVKRAAQPEPQNTRFNFGNRPSSSSSSNNANTRFFTGNGALDAGLAGAAAGFAGQYVANQVFNPCCCWKSLWKIKYFITYDLKLKSDCYKLLINDC